MKKIYVEITNKCNLSCDFCIKNDRFEEFISVSKFKILMDKLKPFTNYLYFHILGEPLLHPKINELIDIASKSFNINITTNGYLIKRIKNNKNIRQLNISIHSFDEKYKVSLDKYLDNIFDTIDKLDNTYISLRTWVDNKHNKEIINYINNRYSVNCPYKIKNFSITDRIFINNFHEFVWPDLNNDYYNDRGKCYGLKDHIGILVDGTVVPCCLDTKGIINLGNIYKDSLDDILSKKRVLQMKNSLLNGIKNEELCKHCNFLKK